MLHQYDADGSRTRLYTDGPVLPSLTLDGLLSGSSSCNVILYQQASRLHTSEATNLLSLRCAFNGPRIYEREDDRFAVDDSAYLILNGGRRYVSRVSADTEVESISVFFQPDFARSVLRALITPEDRLLDEPTADNGQVVQFFEQLYPHDNLLTPSLLRLRDAIQTRPVSEGWLREQFHLLLERMIQVHRHVGQEIARIPAVRHSTRVELYRRLHRARDFMDANLHRPLGLGEIADAAWFSIHHFLRLFKQHFGETPHQYLTRRRLERARTLLIHTDRSVTDICLDIGFESLGSFSWLFSRRMGLSPEKFRLHAAQQTVDSGQWSVVSGEKDHRTPNGCSKQNAYPLPSVLRVPTDH